VATHGWQGWDEYAAFYDWENVRTFGRRDIAFWRDLARRERGPVLELGCGTGRLLMPVARAGIAVTGIDRSAAMLTRARLRARRLSRSGRPSIVRGDIRALPFPRASFGLVMAPYGMLQSLLSDRDLDCTLAEAARVLRGGGLFGVDLVPDLPAWAEYGPRVRLSGARPDGVTVTLVEAVRQDRRRRLTIFDEEFIERRGRRERRRRFSLTFRTLAIEDTVKRIERAGCQIEAVLGDYRGGPWDERADVWMILARKPARSLQPRRGWGPGAIKQR
jgi:SAM-dependent methyltransferase